MPDVSTRKWPSHVPLLKPTEADGWSVGDAFEGTQIFGTNGSGKTSGSAAHIAEAMLREGYGGVVLTAKEDELRRWLSYAKRTGREKDVVVIPGKDALGRPRRFNFLAYVLHLNPAVSSTDLAEILVAAARSNRSKAQFEAYWEGRMMLVASKLIDIARAAASPTISTLRELLSAATDTGSGRWKDYIGRIHKLRRAAGVEVEPEAMANARWHFEQRLISVPERQREGFVDPFFMLLATFEEPIVRDLFDPRPSADAASAADVYDDDYSALFDPEVAPDSCYKREKVIIVNLPTNVWREVGKAAQIIYKQVWQYAMRARFSFLANPEHDPDFVPADHRPVFFFADEAQQFSVPSDVEFQQFARSARIATVYITQSLSNYTSELGYERAHALLANLQTKFFHSNGDPPTNAYAVDLIGETTDPRVRFEDHWYRDKRDISRRETRIKYDREDKGTVSRRLRTGDFTTLQKGSDEQGKIIDAILFQAGRTWKGNGLRNWTDVVFNRWE